MYREIVGKWIVEPQGQKAYWRIRLTIAILLFPIVILPILIEYLGPLCEKFDDYIANHVRRWSAFLLNKINKSYCHLETK